MLPPKNFEKYHFNGDLTVKNVLSSSCSPPEFEIYCLLYYCKKKKRYGTENRDPKTAPLLTPGNIRSNCGLIKSQNRALENTTIQLNPQPTPCCQAVLINTFRALREDDRYVSILITAQR